MENSASNAPATHEPGGTRIGSIEEAAQAMKALRTPAPKPKASTAAQPAEPSPPPETANEPAEIMEDQVVADDLIPEVEAQSEGEGETPEEKADDASEDGPEPEENEDSEVEDAGEPETYTVKVDGKEVEVTLEELKKGYSFNTHNQKLSQELAAQRKEFEQYATQTREKEEVYSRLLPIMVQRLEALMPQAPDPSLLHTDPITHYQLQREYDAKMQEWTLAQAETQRLQSEREQERVNLVQAHIMSERAKLPDIVPEWQNPDVFEQDRQKLVKHLRSRGFTDDEINWAGDARLLRELNDARKFAELQSRKSRPLNPVQKAVQPKAQAPSPNVSKTKAFSQTMQSLEKTGSIADAARAMSLLRG